MKVLEILVIDGSTLIFTDNPERDIMSVQRLYLSGDMSYLGYELPSLVEFKFMGKTYKAISFWHDNEDVRDIDLSSLQ
jgi:hypothetical protein